MAGVSPAADQASGLLQKLSLDSQPKKDDAVDATKKASIPYVSANGGEAQTVPMSDRSLTPLLPEYMDPSMCLFPNAYPAYFYGGYDGSMGEWDSRGYGNRDGVEMSPGMYGDMYGYGYAPYGPYPSPGSPVPTVGHDGQMYAPQHYQYPAPFFQPPTPTPNNNSSNPVPNQTTGNTGSKADLPSSITADKPVVSIDASKPASDGVPNGSANGNSGPNTQLKQNQQNGSANQNGSYRGALQNGLSPSAYPDMRYGFNGVQSPMPWIDSSLYSNGQHRPNSSSMSSSVSHASNGSSRNQNQRSSPHLLGMQRPTSAMGPTAPNYLNRMYPDSRFYGQYSNALKPGLGFGSNVYNSRTNGRWGFVSDKYKPRGRGGPLLYGFGNESQDGFSELNRGPRSGGFKTPKPLGATNQITLAVKGQALPTIGKQDANAVPDREQYNKADFPVTYTDAKFFIIKSYSEDDVHKSVKYNVWASTPNGNKKLDAGYREAQEKSGGCPVFLFFSVNTSGQFVGVAEMMGPVDFEKTVEYWQQDKWNGCFPVKWHIVKDVPNSMLKHIILENNDNKPVTNSRDTQEVKLEQGLEMLKIFKDHVSKTCILDDFLFYENRQKLMQEKKAKQQLQNQVWDEKKDPTGEKENEGAVPKPKIQKPLVSVPISTNKEVVANGNGVTENGVAAIVADSVKILKPPTDKRSANGVVANGLVEGC
ncbi:hypothetical protein LUZ61_000888 [Rhynchospora tenuis]|uniref:YTH domain-containing family protein n=1 Tax=Rhynchospora tenuis TaxID=198213 RepID=A0AAD6EQ86_9POAL|nr:hypothetical protein LUZ61_000888 [Rhynchospora tenuis]